MNPQIDLYLSEGCGRCEFWRTPQCKVHAWQSELKALRDILLDSGLKEELKWAQPCYTFENHNLVLIGALKESCTLSFFKGALLKDPQGILSKPGENSQAGRVIRFQSTKQIQTLEPVLKVYIQEAIEIHKAGLKLEKKTTPEPWPEELQSKLAENLTLKQAFEALTPGRQRGYILYFSAPKQSKTRLARIDKYAPKIHQGLGFHDR